MQFDVIDKRTGKHPDLEKIALKEEWAKDLIYCDIEGFFINEDGCLILADECGNFAYCPLGRFEVIEGEDNSWIDVKDRLPKNENHYFNLSEDCLICDASGEMFVAYYNFRKQCWQNSFKRFTWSDNIIAWKPLPEPYRKK